MSVKDALGTMRSVLIKGSKVVCGQREIPRPASGELLVRVRAAGINGADILQMRSQDLVAAEREAWPGLEFAGEVVAAGEQASRFSPGDRVMSLVPEGGQAEFVVVDERVALPVPTAMTWLEAGGFAETYSTAYDALFSQCNLSVGERLLVNGAAGGVGSAAIQLGVAAGADVTASVRSAQRRPQVAALGGAAVGPDEAFAMGPFDVVLELVGGPNIGADIAALAPGGRIAVIGTSAGTDANIQLRTLMSCRGRLYGSTLRSRLPEEKALLARQIEGHVLPLVLTGAVKVVLDGAYQLEDCARAYEHFVSGGKFGKVVLEVGRD